MNKRSWGSVRALVASKLFITSHKYNCTVISYSARTSKHTVINDKPLHALESSSLYKRNWHYGTKVVIETIIPQSLDASCLVYAHKSPKTRFLLNGTLDPIERYSRIFVCGIPWKLNLTEKELPCSKIFIDIALMHSGPFFALCQ